MKKIGIVGCGNVGISFAYALVNQKTSVTDLVLIDINKDKLLGDEMDLNHALTFAPGDMNINVGNYNDLGDADIIVISAGVNQNEGETRLSLLDRNKKIFKDIISKINETSFNGIYLIATNPVDIMTSITMNYANCDKSKVIGTGTTLDTARLRFMISKKLNINVKNIHGYVIGEHGESEFVPWSILDIGGVSVASFLKKSDMKEIEESVKNAASKIIKLKGSTHYGIGTCLVRIVDAILNNENSILTVSTYDKKTRISFGAPTIINNDGVVKKIFIDLTSDEEKKLQSSINILKKVLNDMED